MVSNEEENLSNQWNEKSNKYNKIINFLESLGVEEIDLIVVGKMIREYEKELMKWHAV